MRIGRIAPARVGHRAAGRSLSCPQGRKVARPHLPVILGLDPRIWWRRDPRVKPEDDNQTAPIGWVSNPPHTRVTPPPSPASPDRHPAAPHPRSLSAPMSAAAG